MTTAHPPPSRDDLVEVQVQLPTRLTVLSLGRGLLTARLAATVRASGPIQLQVRADGGLARPVRAWHLTALTTGACALAARAYLEAACPSAAHDITVRFLTDVSAAYRAWVHDSMGSSAPPRLD